MTTPLLLLRAVQLGIQIGEMDLLTIGTINDMYCEMMNLMPRSHLRMIWIDSKGRRQSDGWTDPGDHR